MLIDSTSLLEGWIFSLLKAYGEPGCGLGLHHDSLYFWSPAAGGCEVDFLIQRGGEFIAIEVKSKETVSPRDFMGLKAIADLRGIRRRILVFMGGRPFKTTDGIEVLPIRHFLNELEAGKI
jgi:hypothetical protein